FLSLRAEQAGPKVELVSEPGIDVRVDRPKDRVLHRGQRDGWLGRELLGQGKCRGEDLRTGDHPVDEALNERFGSWNGPSRHNPPPSARRADPTRKPAGSAPPGHDTEVDLGLAELGVLARDDEVARETELATSS